MRVPRRVDRRRLLHAHVRGVPAGDDAHGACLSDGTCKCDRGWTGLDCSIACSPCVHGDCAMDGGCHCRPGWTLPDCSKKIPPARARPERFFARLGGLAIAQQLVRGRVGDGGVQRSHVGDPDMVAKAIRGRCVDDGDGGDGGFEWDGAGGYLYLTDRLPSDGPGEIAYFRAPGNSSAINSWRRRRHALVRALPRRRRRRVEERGAPVGVPHAPDTDAELAPDVILVGGRPRHGLEPPPWDVWDKHSAYEWCRANFPELALNPRWSKRRLVDVVEAYLDTPQVVLGIRAPRGGKHHPPGACRRGTLFGQLQL